MSFFESELVRSEIEEINELQDKIYKNVFNFSQMSNGEKIDHLSLMEELIEKQKIVYTRLSLSDDPKAKEMKKRILDSAKMLGFSDSVDMNVIFKDVTIFLSTMKERLTD